MKIEFTFLFKSGVEKTSYVEVDETSEEGLKEIIEAVDTSFREGVNGMISVGDSKSEGWTIRCADLSAYNIKLLEVAE